MNSKQSQASNSRQALSLIGQNASKSFGVDPNTKTIPDFLQSLKANSSENQSNQTTVISASEKLTKSPFQVNPIEQTLKNALQEAIEENDIVKKHSFFY